MKKVHFLTGAFYFGAQWRKANVRGVVESTFISESDVLIDPQSTHYTISASSLLLPLFLEDDVFHASVWVGTPSVLQHLIVDTASRWTALDCTCNPKNQIKGTLNQKYKNDAAHSCYNPNRSYSARATMNETKTASETYAEGSRWEGYEVSDLVRLPVETFFLRSRSTYSKNLDFINTTVPTKSVPLTFACQRYLTGKFKIQFADGILGLEYDRSQYSLPQQLHKHRHASSLVTSFCLGDTLGWLRIGGDETVVERTTWQSHTLQWTPLRQHSKNTVGGIYAATIEHVWLGESCLSCHVKSWNSGSTIAIFDTGTTNVFFPRSWKRAFWSAWWNETGQRLKNRLLIPPLALHAMPSLNITFSCNATLEITASNFLYLEEQSNESHQQLRIEFLDVSKGTMSAVLGIHALQHTLLVLDAVKGRVGIARADCSRDP